MPNRPLSHGFDIGPPPRRLVPLRRRAGGHPDAELRALAAKHVRLMREYDELEDAFDATEALVEIPEPPDALILCESDLRLPIFFLRSVGDIIGPDSIDFARNALEGRVLSVRERQRLDEIVSAYDKFADARRLAERRAGLSYIQNRLARLCKMEAKLYAAAGRIPAKSANGVLFKLLISARELETVIDDFEDDTQIGFILASAAIDAFTLAGVEEHREIAQILRAGSEFRPALMAAAEREAPESSR